MQKTSSLPFWQSYAKFMIFSHTNIKILKILRGICQIQYHPNVAIWQQGYIMARKGKLNIRTK